jgi:hypothetical protein
MNLYQEQINRELEAWHKDIVKPAGFMENAARSVQLKIRKLYPQKAQDAITVALKTFTDAVMFGSRFATKFESSVGMSLA